MDWNRIAVASAMGPAAGAMEYDRQRREQSKRRDAEFQIMQLRQEGDTVRINNYTVKKTLGGFDLLDWNGQVRRQFTHIQYLLDYMSSYNLL
jgi:hypothetical protein